jgi:hypothetical protein
MIKKKIAMKQKDALGKLIKHNMGSKLELHWYLFFLHEGPWLCDEKKVCEKVELYDFE